MKNNINKNIEKLVEECLANNAKFAETIETIDDSRGYPIIFELQKCKYGKTINGYCKYCVRTIKNLNIMYICKYGNNKI